MKDYEKTTALEEWGNLVTLKINAMQTLIRSMYEDIEKIKNELKDSRNE